MDASAQAAEQHWRARAQWLALRVNLGWWWHELSPALVGVNFGGAGGLLLFRQFRWPLGLWAVLLGAAWLAIAAWAWWKARPRFYSVADGLLRLETHLTWYNVLSSAAAGGTAWPKPWPEGISSLQWHWGKSGLPLALSALFLLLGLVVPVGPPPRAALPPPSQLPAALQQVESWADTLKKEEFVEKTALDEWQERLDQLKQKPAAEWYNQANLEAADSLRARMAQEIENLGGNLQKASDLVGEMEKFPAGGAPPELDAQLATALANLQNGGLPMSGNLAQALALSKQMSPAQLAQLQQSLKKGAGVLGNMGGKMAGRGQMAGMKPGGQGAGTGGAGSGGPGGGGGAAPLTYNLAPTDLEAKKTEGVSNLNTDAPVLGETMAVSAAGAPKPDEGGDASTAGGSGNAGNGGDAVWRQDLTPQEKAVLQRYFK